LVSNCFIISLNWYDKLGPLITGRIRLKLVFVFIFWLGERNIYRFSYGSIVYLLFSWNDLSQECFLYNSLNLIALSLRLYTLIRLLPYIFDADAPLLKFFLR